MEQYSNLASTTVASGGYTTGSGLLNVASTAGNFPAAPTFRVSVADATTKAVKVILKVTAVNSSTQFAVVAEGTDAGANQDDIVYESVTAGALDQLWADMNMVGAYASLPASGARVGQAYQCTDSIYRFVWGGSAWAAFWGSVPVVLPPSSGWSWLNVTPTNAHVDQTLGVLNVGFDSNGDSKFMCYGRALPAAPFNVDMIVGLAAGGNDDTLDGVWVGKSSDFTGWAYMFRSWLPWILYSVTAGNSNYASPYDNNRARVSTLPLTVRFSDDGTHQYFYWSPDFGLHWTFDNHFSLASATDNRIAIGGNGFACSSSISLISYHEH